MLLRTLGSKIGTYQMPIGAFQNQQTANDYWLQQSSAFTGQYGLNIPQGNLTNDPLVNQLLQQGNAIHSHAILPSTLTLAGGDPSSLAGFQIPQFLNNPGDLTSTQLSPIAQATLGVSNFPSLIPPSPLQPTGFPSDGEVYTGPFGIRPNSYNYVPAGFQTAWFV
jgi:hypothetical protein